MRTLKEKKQRAYAMGYTVGLNAMKADQPYATQTLAKEWLRGLEEGKKTRDFRIAEFQRLRDLPLPRLKHLGSQGPAKLLG